MNQTDVVSLIIVSIVVARGASQGFVRSIAGPICFAIGAIAGYCALLATHNFYIVILIAILAPFLLGWMINSMLYIWAGEQAPRITFISRLFGALVNLVWVSALLSVIILMVTTLRLQDEKLEALRQIIKASIICSLLDKEVLHMDPNAPPSSSCPTNECALNPADAEALANDEDLKVLLANEHLKKVLYDPTIREAIAKRNISKFLSNPAVAELFLDTKLLGNIIKFYPKIRSKMTLAPTR